MNEVRDIIARSRRFAHLIVSCAEEADSHVYDVFAEQKSRLAPGISPAELRADIYRALCDRLAESVEARKAEEPRITICEPDTLPVIWKFRNLPLINRMAFALLVIEEFSSDAAARILRIPDTTLEEKILQSRKMLFDE